MTTHKILVLDDGQTWGGLEDATVLEVTDAGMAALNDVGGTLPMQLPAEQVVSRSPLAEGKPYWVQHIPVLSTTHLAEKTCNGWLLMAEGPDVLATETGWFLRIGPRDCPAEWLDVHGAKYHGDMVNLVQWFWNEGFDGWLRLDGEIGDTVDGLPTYTW